MSPPIASLSLDLDNKWSYLKTHGDPGWENYPSYLDVVTPRILGVLARLGLRITVFVVGQDAALEQNHAALKSIADAGHEIGNHSFHHEPWLHLYSPAEIEAELIAAESALAAAAGARPVGFRGPGYSLSPEVLRTLVRRGYQYDASTLPTFLGPLARAYYFLTAKLNRRQKSERKLLFGRWTEGFRPIRPYWWKLGDERLLEIPVTTMPLVRVPIHVSYLLYLRQFSRAAAWAYFRLAMGLCQACGIGPSLLLHPLDFLGGDDEPDLAFFPAMGMTGAEKVAFVADVLAAFAKSFRVVPVGEHAAALALQPSLRCCPVNLPADAKPVTPPHVPVTEQSVAVGG
jgi:hypothetical protein